MSSAVQCFFDRITGLLFFNSGKHENPGSDNFESGFTELPKFTQLYIINSGNSSNPENRGSDNF